MNLFMNPSLSEFAKLLSKKVNGKAVHDLVLDYDGEVLIDPQVEHPNLDLDKFKVHVRLKTLKPLRDLYNHLLNAWNDNFALKSSFQLRPDMMAR